MSNSDPMPTSSSHSAHWLNKAVVTVLAVVFVAGAHHSLHAQSIRPLDAHAFGPAVVESISSYVLGEEGIALVRPAGNALADVTNRMAAFRSAQVKWHSAQKLVAPFANSPDKDLAAIADNLAVAYGAMADLYGQRIAITERVLTKKDVSMGQVAIDVSKLEARADQVLELIALSTAGVANVLVDAKRSDEKGHATYLKITTEERANLLKQLHELAGTDPENESIDASRPTDRVCALTLWRWLRGPWRGSDAR